MDLAIIVAWYSYETNAYRFQLDSQVLIDFMIRHGFVDPDQEGYIELLSALRSGSPV